MKKFMKAIAFATVMCLVLSTAAFAAVEVTDYATKAVKITVEGVQKGEQVALIVAEAGAEDLNKDTIVFVDQKAAGNSTAVFNATLTGVEAIDVYAGFASNSKGTAVLVAEDVALTEEEEEVTITVTLADVEIVDDITETAANAELGYVAHKADEGTKGAVVKFELNVANATETDEIAGMFWGFIVKADGADVTEEKFVRADQNIVDAINDGIIDGAIEIAAAFESTGYTVEDAYAVLSVNGEDVELVEE